MARTESGIMPIGEKASEFTLKDTRSGIRTTFDPNQIEKGALIIFMCNHCPYVKHVLSPLVALSNAWASKGLDVYAISSNDFSSYPEDAPEKMRELADEMGFPFPYLIDETQEVAKAYGAQCTPEFYLFDTKGACFYRGQFDDSRPGNNVPVTGSSLIHAVQELLQGNPPPKEQKLSLGCGIKWRG